jgi:DNA-directed RNA polymerase subunit RPC12/RpoP
MAGLYSCKCKGCKAEFQAILESEDEVFECPACENKEIDRTKLDMDLSCGGSCGGCAGCH